MPMEMATMLLIKFSLFRYGLKVSYLCWRSIFNFNFEIQVEVYMSSPTLKLQMKIDSDEKIETRFQSFIKQEWSVVCEKTSSGIIWLLYGSWKGQLFFQDV